MIRFDDRVAIVTGAGAGLGREHALGLAARGAKVVVNDFGGGLDGAGGSSAPAEETVALIEAAGGTAFAHGADVANAEQVADMVDKAMRDWGRVDILVNNAGILRDRTFSKMTLADWDAVVRVHLTGAAVCTLAVWPHMKAANYGRIVMTSSSSGLYGNFGQSNYGAAKMAVIGLMNVLHIEGIKNDIRVNTLAPGAATRMTQDLLPPALIDLMDARSVTPGLLYLVSEDAPSRAILCATAGGFSRTLINETEGIHLDPANCTAEAVAAAWAEISDPAGQKVYENGGAQVMKFVGKAAAAAGISLG
ncbi:SDR family NAD(P)-dependent oxidoreductase [Glacieibacterium frigidum]|uniref:SDR family NAD(P)-dependent oxidoreductase n=2 Tax=Glacieibacterium frigidum TaxID=2593303 RepID=A0A552U9P9_9SPHN|nr:SDR family NAD(P)-dependent oxidoreductase [Glacieibacterium frigidum]TRW14930.1 SDR family NAD(P)-dependent oxidoreductase [Glacieibacterium frigidum]